MYARVTTFENATAIDETAKQIQGTTAPRRPRDRVYFMADREAGKVLVVTLFETEADMKKGHETLMKMDPPGGGFGQRTSVELLEVVAHMTA